jgi:hypothetical protein
VALKIIRAGLDTHRLLARFEQERQALAQVPACSLASRCLACSLRLPSAPPWAPRACPPLTWARGWQTSSSRDWRAERSVPRLPQARCCQCPRQWIPLTA